MNGRIFLAEMVIEAVKLHDIEALEINLDISPPPEARGYRQSLHPGSPGPGYPLTAPERNGYHRTGYETKKTGGDLPKSANVRVNSLTVNVKTTRV